MNEFSKFLINSIRIKENFDSDDEVIDMLVREHLDVGKNKNPFDKYDMFNIVYGTQATYKESDNAK